MIKVSMSSEEINLNVDLFLIGRLLDGNSALKRWDAVLPQAHNVKYSNSDIIRTVIALSSALICLRNNDFANVNRFQDDELFRLAISRQVSREAIFRQRLKRLEKSGRHRRRPDSEQKLGGVTAWQGDSDRALKLCEGGVQAGQACRPDHRKTWKKLP